MGFWNFKKNQEKGEESSKSNETKMEQSEKKELTEEELRTEQLIEESIPRVLSSINFPSEGRPFHSASEDRETYLLKEGKGCLVERESYIEDKGCLVEREPYMSIFKQGLLTYLKKWKSIIGKDPYQPELDIIVRNGIKSLARLGNKWLKIAEKDCDDTFNGRRHPTHGEDYELSDLKYNIGRTTFFGDPVEVCKKAEKEKEEQRLNEQIEKLKAIVNKPIQYGSSGKVDDEIDFDKEFNIFAEKLREQKMDEVTIFKLVSRMGELKKQYELVIKRSDRSLLERLEAQVLLEFYEQIKKQEEEQEEKKAQEIEGQARGTEATLNNIGAGSVADSIKQIENGVSTLTWLKIIDGFLGH